MLESNYQQGKNDIAQIIEQLLQTSQLDVQEPEIVWKTLNSYQNSGADFSDYMIAYTNASTGCETTVTFDKKAGKHQLFEIITTSR